MHGRLSLLQPAAGPSLLLLSGVPFRGFPFFPAAQNFSLHGAVTASTVVALLTYSASPLEEQKQTT